MKPFMKRYGLLAAVLMANLCLLVWAPETGRESFIFAGQNALFFVFALTPVFICIGLLDVWVEREAMIKIMGEQSGMRGVLIAFLLGVVTAVPLYALLPVAGMLLKKRCKIANVLIFLCASTSIRIPLLLFEISSMGFGFTAVRFAANIIIVLLIAFLIDRTLTGEDREKIYRTNG